MGYLFLAVVFYTVVKYGVHVWSQLFYAQNNKDDENRFAYITEQLKKKIKMLENRVAVLEKTVDLR